MDDKTFDGLTRAVGAASTRRTALKRLLFGIAGISVAVRSRTAGAASDCADFCRHLAAGHRGPCVADCQAGEGLYVACGGDPTVLCPSADGTSATCCPANSSCQDGVCVCSPSYGYCSQTGQCVDAHCPLRQQFSSTSCQCECLPPRSVPLVESGYCSFPCSSDADCPFEHYSCQQTIEGQSICGSVSGVTSQACTESYPCTTSAFCQSCTGGAVNPFCGADGVCHTAA
jgi:hypothetical protein